MFQKILLTTFITLGLTGCVLPGTQIEGSTTESMFVYSGSGFSVSLPKNWNALSSINMPSPYHGLLMVAYVSPEVKYGFSNNILIMKDALSAPMTSKKYSELNYVQATKNYLEHTKLQDGTITFSDSDESRVYVFEARYNTTTSRMKFIQTAKVCGMDVYLLHVTVSLDKDADDYINLLQTFQCK